VRFLHFSDPHLTADPAERLYGQDTHARLAAALEHAAKHFPDSAFLALTGDLSADGSPGSYRRLAELLERCPIPACPIPGNHDDRAVFAEYFPQFVGEGGFIQYAREEGERLFLFLDTLEEGEEYGVLCDTRLAWLQRQLERYRDREIHLLMHHHPLPCGLRRMDTVANFRTQEAFWSLLERYEGIRAIHHGHLHLETSTLYRGILIHSAPSTAFSLLYRPGEEDELLTPDLPGAYSVVECEDWGCRVDRVEYEVGRVYQESF